MPHERSDGVGLPPFVPASWVSSHAGELVIADVRWHADGGPDRAAFERGHLPAAVFVDLDSDLSGAPGSEGLHPLPDATAFAGTMARLGIGDDSTVVAYDDVGGVIAARMVWMLRTLGRRAALLDGGLDGWDGPLVPGPSTARSTGFTATRWGGGVVASRAEVQAFTGVLVDARDPDRYDGTLTLPTDPRPGHIPGAVNLPCRASITADGHLRPVHQLRGRLADVGISEQTEVISYCGSGVAACHVLLTLEHAGMGRGRLYVGGWSDYAGSSVEALDPSP